MKTITVYEKPTCTTCRNLTALFKENGVDWERVNYFIEPFTEEKLSRLIGKMGMRPYEVLRRAEPEVKGLGLTPQTPDAEVIKAMADHPAIIQRPIVELGDKAILARPWKERWDCWLVRAGSVMKILDVGCGKNKTEGAVGLDNNPRTGADVIHDLGTLPYPFSDNEFDLVVSNHVVEHVPDVIAFITELHRVTKPGGRIRLLTPHYTNPDWANDPTHRNHINSYTFNTFLSGRRVFDFYTEVELRLVKCHVSLLSLWKILGIQFIVNLDQRFSGLRFTRKFWEQYLSYMLRGKEITFEFEVIKEPVSKLAG